MSSFPLDFVCQKPRKRCSHLLSYSRYFCINHQLFSLLLGLVFSRTISVTFYSGTTSTSLLVGNYSFLNVVFLFCRLSKVILLWVSTYYPSTPPDSKLVLARGFIDLFFSSIVLHSFTERRSAQSAVRLWTFERTGSGLVPVGFDRTHRSVHRWLYHKQLAKHLKKMQVSVMFEPPQPKTWRRI